MENKVFFYNIQIARGIAAILVIMSHANLMLGQTILNGLFLPGWSGVHFFFVLSGFIIFYGNSNDIANPAKLKSYALKRFKRIFPIYWLYTLGALILNYFFLYFVGHNFITWSGHDLSSVIQSIALWPTNMDGATMFILPVAWTLTYEVIFYIVFAALIFSAKRLSYCIVCTWVLFIIFASFGLIETKHPLLFVTLNSLNLEFLFGCLAAYLVKQNKLNLKPHFVLA